MEQEAAAGPAGDVGPRRPRLNRERVLSAAILLADEIGIDALSMRRLAQELDVVPMALYKHVAHKEELLDGMVEAIVAEIDPPLADVGWRTAVRTRILSARAALHQHSWARRVVESRTTRTPGVLAYIDSMAGLFLAGGFSIELTHHVMHAMGGRMWGFTQELFDDPSPAPIPPDQLETMMRQAAAVFPNLVAVASYDAHDGDTVVGHGCDDAFEFAFALDLMLDGFERLNTSGWSRHG